MLLCFSSSHRTADFDLLDRLERHSPNVTAALSERSDLIAGFVVLATCNRFEAYIDVEASPAMPPDDAVEAVIDAVSHAADVDANELRTASEVSSGGDVAAHLFAVTSGLESVVVGEVEIAGQVRRALESARSAGTVTSELERLFQVASHTSRGVKNKTGITSAGRSIARLALDLGESRITDWALTHVLLIGTGAYAGATLAALRERGVTEVLVYSPSGRASRFAASHAVSAVPLGGLEAAVAASDLVIACSVSPDTVLTKATVDAALASPGAIERRLIIDLGLPRNVEQTVAECTGVELLDLETISLHAPLADLNATDEARSLVGEAAAEFSARGTEHDVAPALVAMRTHVFDLLDAEIDRARKRGDSSEQTEAALRHLAGVLLHTPSVRAKELARNGEADRFIEAANILFGIEPAPRAEVSADARADHEQPMDSAAS